MQEVGEVMHLAGSGRVIVRLTERLAEGQVLCDLKGTRVAKVMELIGPVSRPFASASALTNSPKRYVGRSVYAAPHTARTQRPRRTTR